jgi:hypothetical protein
MRRCHLILKPYSAFFCFFLILIPLKYFQYLGQRFQLCNIILARPSGRVRACARALVYQIGSYSERLPRCAKNSLPVCVCVCVYIYICIYIHTYTYIRTHIHTHIYIYTHTGRCVCMYIYIYIYIYIYTHTHVCICVYIYIHTRTHTHIQGESLYSFIHVVCLTTGPKPLPKRAILCAMQHCTQYYLYTAVSWENAF